MDQSFIDKTFSFLVRKKNSVITVFKLSYILLFLFFSLGAWIIISSPSQALWFFQTGILCGKAALLLYIITMIPGITRRFGLRNKPLSLVMIFRRYIGISMYLFAFIHFSFVRIIVLLLNFTLAWNFALFELFGIAAATTLFFLFITSNDLSVHKLNVWWYRLHKLTYISMFFIFLHVALQKFSVWTIMMGIIILLQAFSFVYSRMINKIRPHPLII